jgi:hypothetical protein
MIRTIVVATFSHDSFPRLHHLGKCLSQNFPEQVRRSDTLAERGAGATGYDADLTKIARNKFEAESEFQVLGLVNQPLQ